MSFGFWPLLIEFGEFFCLNLVNKHHRMRLPSITASFYNLMKRGNFSDSFHLELSGGHSDSQTFGGGAHLQRTGERLNMNKRSLTCSRSIHADKHVNCHTLETVRDVCVQTAGRVPVCSHKSLRGPAPQLLLCLAGLPYRGRLLCPDADPPLWFRTDSDGAPDLLPELL